LEHQPTVKKLGCFKTQPFCFAVLNPRTQPRLPEPELESLNTVDMIVRVFHNTASLSGTGTPETGDRIDRVFHNAATLSRVGPLNTSGH
jgi:hypothetical protein